MTEKKHCISTFAALALTATAAAPALADERANTLESAGNTVAAWIDVLRDIDAHGTAGAPHWAHGARCRELYDSYAGQGVAPDDVLANGTFKGWPGAGKNADGVPSLRMRDFAAICDRIAVLHPVLEVARELEGHMEYLAGARIIPDDLTKAEDAHGPRALEVGKACGARLERAKKEGVAFDVPVKMSGKGPWTLAQRVEVCDELVKIGEHLSVAVPAAKKSAHEARVKKLVAAGVKGDRLALFLERGHEGWLGKGCREIEDLKVAAKAKKLFEWLTSLDDGTITIRTYTFKGNKYKVSERYYLTEEAAYRGCK